MRPSNSSSAVACSVLNLARYRSVGRCCHTLILRKGWYTPLPNAVAPPQIWSIVKAHHKDHATQQGLDKQQFADFLKLVAVAQAGHELDEDTVDLAMQPSHEWMRAYGTPLPSPSIQPAADSASSTAAAHTSTAGGSMASASATASLLDAFTSMRVGENTDGVAAAPLERVASGSHRPPPPIPTSPATRDGDGIASRKGSFQPRRPAPVAGGSAAAAAAASAAVVAQQVCWDHVCGGLCVGVLTPGCE